MSCTKFSNKNTVPDFIFCSKAVEYTSLKHTITVKSSYHEEQHADYVEFTKLEMKIKN